MTLLLFFFLGDELSCTEYIQLELDLFHGIRSLPSIFTASVGFYVMFLKIQTDSFGAFLLLKNSKN